MRPAGGDGLWGLLRGQVGAAALEWLGDAVETVRHDRAALARLFPAVGRHVGREPLRSSANGATRPGLAGQNGVGDDPTRPGTAVPEPGGAWAAGAEEGEARADGLGWTVDDAGRVLLLLAGGEAAWDEIDDLYRYGDTAERRAVLRSLAYLPSTGGDDRAGSGSTAARTGHDADRAGDVGLALVEDALRTNDPRLVAAALGPYAVERLPDEAFDQAILKCVFVGVPLAALPEAVGRRASPALARMLAAYVRERVAAGRDVPPDVWPLIDAHPPLDELAAIEAELTHPRRSRRQAAAAALGQRSAHHRVGVADRDTDGSRGTTCGSSSPTST